MVSRASRRHFLKEKEVKKLLADISKRFKVEVEKLFGSELSIEIAEAQTTKIFIINREPLLAESGNELFPTLLFEKLFPSLPKVVVDMGAISHVCNGADVMAPGVVRIEGKFDEKDFLLITDERHGKPLAIGVALFDSQVIRTLRRGKIVKTIHHVGDKLWSVLKDI